MCRRQVRTEIDNRPIPTLVDRAQAVGAMLDEWVCIAAVAPKVVMTEAEWKAKLTPASFTVARQEGTERPGSGELLNEHRKGIFRCICCDTALFDSATKFESGTGWPSFSQPVDEDHVATESD